MALGEIDEGEDRITVCTAAQATLRPSLQLAVADLRKSAPKARVWQRTISPVSTKAT
jgi:hypothetical protein